MRINFEKVTMKNFKGVLGERTIEFSPRRTYINGRNRTGKTTVADALQWVLFGKNSQGQSTQNFDIKPNDKTGQFIPHLDHEVTLTMTADGSEYTLTRRLVENWRKPKQQEEAVFDGNTTEYFVNGENYTEKDYQAFITGMMSEELFRCVTNPEYFPSLDAKAQRALLTKMVGERPIEEIAEQYDDFKQLLTKMEGKDLAKYRQHLAYRIKKVKDTLAGIPERINEQQNELKTLQEKRTDFPQIDEEIKKLDKDIADLDSQIADQSKFVDVNLERKIQLRKDIAENEQTMADVKSKAEQEHARKKADRNKEVQSSEAAYYVARNAVQRKQREIEQADEDIKVEQQAIARVAAAKQDFKTRWAAADEESFSWDTNQEYCPTCGQRLPSGNIEEMRRTQEAEWNTRHAQKMDELEAEADGIKTRERNAQARLDAARGRKQSLQGELDGLQAKATATEQAMHEAKAKPIEEMADYRNDERYILAQHLIEEKRAELQSIEDEEKTIIEQHNQENAEIGKRNTIISETKTRLYFERDQLRDLLANRETIDRKNSRIRELQGEEKTLNQQLADLEREDATAEQFQFECIRDLERRVNGLFEIVTFKMFKTLINGTIQPTCECLVDGARYGKGLNREACLNAGIDIIKAISRQNDAYAPMIIDNAESTNRIMETEAQQILLTVTDDEQLTVAHE